MILTLIFIFMLLLGLVLIWIDDNTNADTDISGVVLTAFGSVFLIIAIIVIIITHACADHTIKQNQINYEGLCKRYEISKSEYEDVSKSDVIADITSWNMEVYNTKYWTENPWTNWFNPREIANNLEYIPLDEESEE